MNAYLLSVIGTVLISAVLTAIIPNGKTATVIRGVAKLACVVAIVSPVLQFFQTGKLGTEGGENSKNNSGNFQQIGIQADEEFIQYYCEIRVRETERALETELKEEFDAETQVVLQWELQKENVENRYLSEEIFIEEIQILWKGERDESMQKTVCEYVENRYGCEVLIE